jgi:hypothetical protein
MATKNNAIEPPLPLSHILVTLSCRYSTRFGGGCQLHNLTPYITTSNSIYTYVRVRDLSYDDPLYPLKGGVSTVH